MYIFKGRGIRGKAPNEKWVKSFIKKPSAAAVKRRRCNRAGSHTNAKPFIKRRWSERAVGQASTCWLMQSFGARSDKLTDFGSRCNSNFQPGMPCLCRRNLLSCNKTSHHQFTAKWMDWYSNFELIELVFRHSSARSRTWFDFFFCSHFFFLFHFNFNLKAKAGSDGLVWEGAEAL